MPTLRGGADAATAGEAHRSSAMIAYNDQIAPGSAAVTNLLAITGGARSMSGPPAVLPAKLVVRESTTRRR